MTQIIEDQYWKRFLPERGTQINEKEWRSHGGKWIIFDRMGKIQDLVEKLEDSIESGEVQSAKYWNRDPSAICVYTLDRNKEQVWDLLKSLGAPNTRVWEYDYAWDKNVQRPWDFFYSQASKFRTILRSYGCRGTVQLMRDALTPGRASQESGTAGRQS